MDVIKVASCTSALDVAREALKGGASAPLAVLADYQTAGRGQYGRRWEAAPKSALLAAIALPESGIRAPEVASLAAGLALARTVEALGVKASLKWPNDLLAAGAKLGGILIERHSGNLLFGLGLNLQNNSSDNTDNTDNNTRTSLAALTGRSVAAEAALDLLLPRLLDALSLDREEIIGEWSARAVYPGALLRRPEGPQPASPFAIDRNGALLARLADGTVATIHSSGEFAR